MGVKRSPGARVPEQELGDLRTLQDLRGNAARLSTEDWGCRDREVGKIREGERLDRSSFRTYSFLYAARDRPSDA